MNITRSILNNLNEDFRDTEQEIDVLEEQLYNLIEEYNYNISYKDLYSYIPDEEWYEDDIEKFNELKNRISKLKEQRDKNIKNQYLTYLNLLIKQDFMDLILLRLTHHLLNI